MKLTPGGELTSFLLLDLSPGVASQEEGVHGPARASPREAPLGEQQLPADNQNLDRGELHDQTEVQDPRRREQQSDEGAAAVSVPSGSEESVCRHQSKRKALTTG